LFATILALAICASAQQQIDFAQLSNSGVPSSIPENYAGLHWSGIDAVNALTYGDAGAGFSTGPEVMVAFGGGPLCFPIYGGLVNDGSASKNICESTITSGFGTDGVGTFQIASAVVASGWTNGSIVVTAYNNGVKVGSSQKYSLTTTSTKLVFPNWGPITQLVIHPSPNGSFVLYVLQLE
jgi:hypothetical protein